jgi:hypothetical protein
MGAILALALLPTGVFAQSLPDDGADLVTIYSTDACRGRFDRPQPDVWRGRTFNMSASPEYIHCPIWRHLFDRTPDLKLTMNVVDQNPSTTAKVACALWTENPASFDGWSGMVSGRNSTRKGVVESLSLAVAPFSSYAFYTIECELPAKVSDKPSQIVDYYTTER